MVLTRNVISGSVYIHPYIILSLIILLYLSCQIGTDDTNPLSHEDYLTSQTTRHLQNLPHGDYLTPSKTMTHTFHSCQIETLAKQIIIRSHPLPHGDYPAVPMPIRQSVLLELLVFAPNPPSNHSEMMRTPYMKCT